MSAISQFGNGQEMGNVVAIAGKDYVVIGSDSRLARNLLLVSRTQDKLFPMGKRIVLGAVGLRSHVLALQGVVRAELVSYEVSQERPLRLASMANMIGVAIRFGRVRYYVYAVLAGVDDAGEGWVFGYNPRGPTPERGFCVVGSGAQLIHPILLSQISVDDEGPRTLLSLEAATSLVRGVFDVAADRDVYTGDRLRINVITQGGVEETCYPLCKD